MAVSKAALRCPSFTTTIGTSWWAVLIRWFCQSKTYALKLLRTHGPNYKKKNDFLWSCMQKQYVMLGKRRRRRRIDNIKKWTRASIEENIRLTEDRTAWREISCAAGAADVRTNDAD